MRNLLAQPGQKPDDYIDPNDFGEQNNKPPSSNENEEYHESEVVGDLPNACQSPIKSKRG